MTSLSIVIVSYRCWQRLAACIQSIQTQSLDFLEVIVVDNHSNDGKINQFIKAYPTVHLIQQEINGGFAQACNKGAAIAKGEWILFLNPDTILVSNSLSPLIQRANTEPSWKLIGIKQLDEKGRDTYPFGLFLHWWNVWPLIRSIQRLMGGKKMAKKTWSTVPVSFPDWISGSFVLMRNADFKTIGGWDERFWMYFEDMDLSMAANKLGWKRVIYNEIQCMHSHGGSSRINHTIKAITKAAVIQSNFKYINKHFTVPSKWMAQLTLFLMTFINLFLAFPFSKTKRLLLKELVYSRR